MDINAYCNALDSAQVAVEKVKSSTLLVKTNSKIIMESIKQ